MAEIPKDNRLITSQPASTGTNPFDYKGIQPRTGSIPVFAGSNNTAPKDNPGYKSGSPKVGYNEKC